MLEMLVTELGLVRVVKDNGMLCDGQPRSYNQNKQTRLSTLFVNFVCQPCRRDSTWSAPISEARVILAHRSIASLYLDGWRGYQQKI